MDYTNLINDILYVVIVAILPIITKYVVDAIKTYVTYYSERNEDNSAVIYKAEEIVSDIVISLNQTVVDAAKKSGNFNKETQEQVKREAVTKCYELINDAAKVIIRDTYNSFNSWLDVQIEKYVNENK